MATAGADVTGDDTATTGASNASNGENNFNSCKESTLRRASDSVTIDFDNACDMKMHRNTPTCVEDTVLFSLCMLQYNEC